jgi:protein SCO1/2
MTGAGGSKIDLKKRVALMTLAALVGSLVGYGLFLLLDPTRQAEEQETRVAVKPLVGGPFELVNQDGELVSEKDFLGRPMLIYFGYATCPDVCPLDLMKMSQSLKLLGDAGETVQPIFISIDPERDTPEVIKTYVSRFADGLIGLTGSNEQVATAAKAYRVYYAKTGEDGGEAVDGETYWMAHSNLFYLMDEAGTFLAFFDADATPETMAEGLRQHLNLAP